MKREEASAAEREETTVAKRKEASVAKREEASVARRERAPVRSGRGSGSVGIAFFARRGRRREKKDEVEVAFDCGWELSVSGRSGKGFSPFSFFYLFSPSPSQTRSDCG